MRNSSNVAHIVLSVPVLTQDPEARSLPSLTDIIDFLEQVERSHPFIQRIAIRLYSWAKGIDQLHLYQIASIHFELAGGRSW